MSMPQWVSEELEARMAKLPKWAKDEIALLKMRLSERDTLIRQLQDIGSNKTEGGIVIDPYAEYPIVFSDDNTVRVWVKPGRFALDISKRGAGPGVLAISGYSLKGLGTISIHPRAGNVVWIGEDGR